MPPPLKSLSYTYARVPCSVKSCIDIYRALYAYLHFYLFAYFLVCHPYIFIFLFLYFFFGCTHTVRPKPKKNIPFKCYNHNSRISSGSKYVNIPAGIQWRANCSLYQISSPWPIFWFSITWQLTSTANYLQSIKLTDRPSFTQSYEHLNAAPYLRCVHDPFPWTIMGRDYILHAKEKK